ncbi:MAG: hypothetical protein RLZZ373_3193 [Pseudomonadota bacterium]|jgi:hypothetical protein
MVARTQDDFLGAALAQISQYPRLAMLAQVNDPWVMAQIRAASAQLAMLSQQAELLRVEPFMKTLDSTVLADAAMRGILPLARAPRAVLAVTNGSDAAYTLQEGRKVSDQRGRVWGVESSVTVPAREAATVIVAQHERRTVTHTTGADQPFYRIEVLQDQRPVYMTAVDVWDVTHAAAHVQYRYAREWMNVPADDRAYQVEVDERRRMWIQFGVAGVVGTQPVAGQTFEVRVTETEGRVVDLANGAEFALEYIFTAADAALKMTLTQMADSGSEPHTVDELRVIASYPALYNDNAVFLGEFGVLLRRNFSGVRFLSVWNEQVQEKARGASVDWINTLFVSGWVGGMADAAFQRRTAEIIGRADPSLKIRFYDPVIVPVPVAITATVAAVHDIDTVRAQILSLVLQHFGDGAQAVSVGLRPSIKSYAITKLLKQSVQALQDDLGDLHVTVTVPAGVMPESFLICTADAITITLSRADHTLGLVNY